MHRSLVPELRGAHRFLRSRTYIRTSIPQQRSQHRQHDLLPSFYGRGRSVTVRSFSSYRRLQDKAPNATPNGSERDSKEGDVPTAESQPARGLDALWQRIVPDTTQAGSNPESNGEGQEGSKFGFSPWEVFDKLREGKLPDGWHIARSQAELPRSVTEKHDSGSVFPACYSLNKTGYDAVLPLPKDFPLPEDGKTASHLSLPSLDPATMREDDVVTTPEAVQEDSDRRTFAERRRRRAQKHRSNTKSNDSKSDRSSSFPFSGLVPIESQSSGLRQANHSRAPLELPEWFVLNNIRSTSQSEQSSPAVDASAADGGAAELQVRTPESVETPSLKQTYSAPPSNSAPIPDSKSTTPTQPLTPQYSSENTVSLANGRYFIDAAQYKEVLSTLKGRLRRIATSKSSDMHHLTILHTTKFADRLLDALVEDLCTSVNGNSVKIGPQDLTNLLMNAETAPRAAQKISKLSYNIYAKIYTGTYQQHESDAREEEEDEDEDEDDDEDDGPSFDRNQMPSFKLQSVVALPMGRAQGGGSGFGERLSRMLGSVPEDAFDSKHFHNMNASDAHSNVEKLAEAVVDQGLAAQRHSTNETSTSPRPLIIHIPTYTAMHDNNGAAEAFLRALRNSVELKSTPEKPIIIVGTDVLRNLNFIQDQSRKPQEEHPAMLAQMFNLSAAGQSSTSSPRTILDQQETMSFGSAGTIVLTSVLPSSEAGEVFIQDREATIRDINMRHLFQALRARGVDLRGIEDGFWTDNYTLMIGEQDCKVLSSAFWPYFHVQRLAAIISGLDSNLDNPITDASCIITESDESKVAWAKHFQTTRQRDGPQPESKLLSTIRAKASQHEKKLMAGVIEPRKIATTFNDIHIPTDTVDTLQMLTSLSLIRPEAFKYGVLKSDRIPGLLLYGPPGTGKTLAAKAVAKESGATMLEVSGADLNDMYVGEGEKNVKALFSLAKKLSPCVVFIDEADAMFSTRSSGARKTGHRELLNQFLKEWDGMSNDSGSAFIMVATNRPMDLDDAVLRRLPRRLLVDLPTEDDRHEILNIHLRNEQLDAAVDLKDLANKTPFYSGSDLKNLAVAAALQAVREENEAAKKWRLENPETKTTYTYPDKRILTQPHFDKALQEISASISEDMSSLRAIKKFDEQYGDRKGRKKRGSRWGFKSATEADKIIDTVKVRS